MTDKDITVGRPIYNPKGGDPNSRDYDVVKDALQYLEERGLGLDSGPVLAEALAYTAMDEAGKAEWLEQQYEKAVSSSVDVLLKTRRYLSTQSEDILLAVKLYIASTSKFLAYLKVPETECAMVVGMAFALRHPDLARTVFEEHKGDDTAVKLLDDNGEMAGRTIKRLWDQTGRPEPKESK